MEYTGIKSENIEYFIPIIPDNFLERLYRDRFCYGLGISDKGKAIGILVYSIDPKDLLRRLELIYISVSKEYQRKGVATAALRELARVCYHKGYYLHCTFPYSVTNYAIYDLFSNTGVFSFNNTPGNIGFIKKEDIVNHEYMEKSEKKAFESIQSYLQISSTNKKEIYKILLDAGYDRAFIMGETYSEFSYFSVNKQRVEMFVIINPAGDIGDYEVSYLFSKRDNNTVRLIKMLITAFSHLADKMNEESKVYITTTNERIENIVKKAFPNIHIESKFLEAIYDGNL